MAYEIIAGKEMGCGATKVEIANDDASIQTTFFWILNNSSENLEEKNESNEELRYTEDVIYEVLDEERLKILSQNKPPSKNVLNSKKVFYFLTFQIFRF